MIELEGIGFLTMNQISILRDYMDCNMNMMGVARRRYLGRTAVDYHINVIARNTGLNPRKFYDLVKFKEAIDKLERKEEC